MPAPGSSPSWFEHVDLMQIIIAALVSIVGFFLVRYINAQTKTNESQAEINKDLYNRHNQLHSDFHELKGEHKVCTAGGRRCYDPPVRPGGDH